jgi:cytochrome b6-f complex iron-sulfur subunit
MPSNTPASKTPDTAGQPSRREAFGKLGVGSIAVAGAGAVVFGYAYISPNVLYEPSLVANVGKPEMYARDSITQDLKCMVYVVHDSRGFYAIASTCTHLGCQTAWNLEQGIIACPCHGSKYNTRGVKIDGPAPRDLPWLRMWINEEGDLMVDRSKVVAPGHYLRV